MDLERLVSATGGDCLVEANVRGTPTLFISGEASWAPGQLAGEVRNGSWGGVGGRYVEREWFGQTFSGRRLAGIYESEPRLAFHSCARAAP